MLNNLEAFDMYSKQYTLCILLRDIYAYLLLFSLNQTLTESLWEWVPSVDLDKDQPFVQSVFDVNCRTLVKSA